MMEERTQQWLILSLRTERVGNSLPEFQHMIGNEVGQVGVFGVIPNLLGRIKLGSVRRQPLNMDASAKASFDFLDTRLVDLPPVQHQRDWSAESPQQLRHELDKILADDVVVENV